MYQKIKKDQAIGLNIKIINNKITKKFIKLRSIAKINNLVNLHFFSDFILIVSNMGYLWKFPEHQLYIDFLSNLIKLLKFN